MSIRIFSNDFVPKYVDGKWVWNEKQQQMQFQKNVRDETLDYIPKSVSWTKFKPGMNQAEELLFVEKFWRKPSSKDSDVIIMQDIKNLVLFLAVGDGVDGRFVEFFHAPIVDKFLNDLIIYFEYYFKFLEFLLAQRKRDDSTESKLRDKTAMATEVALSEYMDQYRIILAREYCQILLGADGAKRFHHMANALKLSYKDMDLNLMETFASFCVQIAWIGMHRKNFDAIDFEINRLFRSNHFNVVKSKALKLTSYEERLLYGKSFNDIASPLEQRSPLATELLTIAPKNIKYMWLGQLKYNGTSKRMIELELEYVTPDAHLFLADVSHGILGHPRKLYDTLLRLNRDAVRKEKFTLDYDPYRLIRQPFINLPDPTVTHEVTLPPAFSLEKEFDKKEMRRNIAKWKTKSKFVKAMNLKVLSDAVSAVKAAEMFTKSNIEEMKIDHEALIEEYLEGRIRE